MSEKIQTPEELSTTVDKFKSNYRNIFTTSVTDQEGNVTTDRTTDRFTIPEDNLDRALRAYLGDGANIRDAKRLVEGIQEDFCSGSDARNWLVCDSKYSDNLYDFVREFDWTLRTRSEV